MKDFFVNVLPFVTIAFIVGGVYNIKQILRLRAVGAGDFIAILGSYVERPQEARLTKVAWESSFLSYDELDGNFPLDKEGSAQTRVPVVFTHNESFDILRGEIFVYAHHRRKNRKSSLQKSDRVNFFSGFPNFEAGL